MDKVAILYQKELPPEKDGIQKPMKPGGYSDSGADIAHELKSNEVDIVTPVEHPDIENDMDWVFPDTKAGIKSAINKGANVFWLNTVLYNNHAVEYFFNADVKFVGQIPNSVDVFDDKTHTNALLKSNNIPIPEARNITSYDFRNQLLGLDFPLVLKPVRGRGSQGVVKIGSRKELIENLHKLFSENRFGNTVYVEKYLTGQEITITVMPKGSYQIDNKDNLFESPWCLPAVKRFNHQNGIAPYSGLVAVVENSEVLSEDELQSKELKEVYLHCIKAAELVGIKAPIRIDCRANEKGEYFLFDLNMKPNMTGPSRVHRQDQDSLTLLAAKRIGWSYFDLLNNILNQKWKADS